MLACGVVLQFGFQRSEVRHVPADLIRELLYNTAQRRRSDQTLAALSEALGWPPGHLRAVAEGRDPGDPDAGDPVLAELAALKEMLTTLTCRIDAIERQLAGDGEQT